MYGYMRYEPKQLIHAYISNFTYKTNTQHGIWIYIYIYIEILDIYLLAVGYIYCNLAKYAVIRTQI